MKKPARRTTPLLPALTLFAGACTGHTPAPHRSVAPPPAQHRPPPPPPAFQPATIYDFCTPGPFIVYFAWGSAKITPQAAAILAYAVEQYRPCGRAYVRIAGFTDRSGPPAYNIALAKRRADAVKAYFAAHAIDQTLLFTKAFGENPDQLRVNTPDGVQQLENRRVEITYGPEPD